MDRLEVMKRTDINEGLEAGKDIVGITHIAFKVGSNEKVDRLTKTLREEGYVIAGEPRTTGDGYYESVMLDSDGNKIELVANA
jgi:lactoylglutathione lyase